MFDWFDIIIDILSGGWEIISLLFTQLIAWFKLLFTTSEFMTLIPYILPATLSGIAILTVGAAVVKAIFGR